MALQKQNFNLNFADGLDTKTDPFQVAPSKFLRMENTVRKNGLGLVKRNGFGALTTLANSAGSTITTLNGNLLATGSILQAYSADTDQWLNQGTIQPVDVRTSSVVRNSTSQTGADVVIASNGLMCTTYTDNALAYYQISDSSTGQSIVARTLLPSAAASPRAHVLGQYFVITFISVVATVPTLQYIAIPIATPASPIAAATISSQADSATAAYDALVVNNSLFVAWDASDVGDAVRVAYLSSSLIVSSSIVYAASKADKIAITADVTTSVPTIWISFYTASTGNIFAAARTSTLIALLAPTVIANNVVANLTVYAASGVCTTFWEVTSTYSFSSVASNYIRSNTILLAGTVGTAATVSRSVGLASKAFADSIGTKYILTAYGGAFQPTYFLMDASGNVVAKIAYANGGGYVVGQVLASVTALNGNYYVPYLIKDLLVSVNRNQSPTSPGGIYTQTGINLVAFQINSSAQYSNEIENVLQLTGGIPWMYDGVKPVEHSFHLWPESLVSTTSGAGGLLTAQQYYYIACYEWTDAQGNLHRSAPSLPLGQVTAGATSTNTVNVPTLRLTYKTGQNPVRIVLYRWSTAQQNYYQITSIASPTLNSTTTDSIAYVDTLADSSILGNTLLYTTGGVIENIAAPAAAATALFKSRQFLLNAENRNVLSYSKQVIQNTPVEFSDLLTIYVPPTTGAQGSTGEVTALSAMDDKLIVFKAAAIYYITGTGPDNTGANNDFSDPVYISGTAGTSNPDSIVLTPQGIMFQSDKGIWLLGRDLSTKYLGADVEQYNSDVVVSALTVPGTNEVRFSLDSGTVLVYDYYYSQWGTFSNIPATSSTLYAGMHTYLNALGQVRQETAGLYLDGSNPVLIKFTTSWLKLTGLQGYQRAYFFYILSNYLTPYKLNIEVAYDYKAAITQTTLLTPSNTYTTYGSDALYGSGGYGDGGGIDQRRVFLNQQKCQSMQVTITEIYDASVGISAGAGLTMSGINFVVGAKDNKPKLAAAQSA